jgi:hypothetical protein
MRYFSSILFFLFYATLFAEETIGKRPYEMVNAGRNQDAHPALVDFENLDGWTVETAETEATFGSVRRSHAETQRTQRT